jgi:hypothetical protein
MKEIGHGVKAHRSPGRHAAAAALLGVALAMGCGGGDVGQAATTPPVNYAGTYTCIWRDGTLNAVLTTAAGNFSSCNGSATPYPGDNRTITCQGSVTADGAFNISGVDNRGITVQWIGTATATTVTGTFHAFTAAGTSTLPFECTR